MISLIMEIRGTDLPVFFQIQLHMGIIWIMLCLSNLDKISFMSTSYQRFVHRSDWISVYQSLYLSYQWFTRLLLKIFCSVSAGLGLNILQMLWYIRVLILTSLKISSLKKSLSLHLLYFESRRFTINSSFELSVPFWFWSNHQLNWN
jgi:hypothetical protein